MPGSQSLESLMSYDPHSSPKRKRKEELRDFDAEIRRATSVTARGNRQAACSKQHKSQGLGMKWDTPRPYPPCWRSDMEK